MPMPTTLDYEQLDYEHVRVLLEGWTPDPLPTPNWRGLVQENRPIQGGAPVPSGNAAEPTMFGAWNLTYDELDGDYEGATAPVRNGRLTIGLFTEPGAGKGALRQIRSELRQLLDAHVADAPIEFDVQLAKTVKVGQTGGGAWFAENFIVPFVGG